MEDTIHTYTRAQAIDDGVLVDLTDFAKKSCYGQTGFKFPIACTARVFAECIELTPAAKAAGQDIKGRLHDVLWMLRVAIFRAASTDRIGFQLSVTIDGERPTLTRLLGVCGPGDNAEPVITIMFPDED